MFSSLALLFLALALPASAATCPSVTCHDVHFFLARGNNEPYPGRQGDLVAATCSGLSSCGYEDLIYSALYTDLSCQSTYDGAVAGLTQIPAYVEACPDSKIILAGYSQGAQIMTDILGGGGGVSFNGCVQPETPALSRSTSPGSKSEISYVFSLKSLNKHSSRFTKLIYHSRRSHSIWQYSSHRRSILRLWLRLRGQWLFPSYLHYACRPRRLCGYYEGLV